MNPNINPVIAVSEVRRERYMPVDGLLRLLGSDKEIERAIDSYLRYAVSVLPLAAPTVRRCIFIKLLLRFAKLLAQGQPLLHYSYLCPNCRLIPRLGTSARGPPRRSRGSMNWQCLLENSDVKKAPSCTPNSYSNIEVRLAGKRFDFNHLHQHQISGGETGIRTPDRV